MPFSAVDLTAIRLSLQVAIVATLLALPGGFATAYLLNYGRFRGKIVLEVLINLPLTLPPVVIGYLLLLLLGREGWLGRFLAASGVQILFTWRAAAIATAVVGFPLLVKAMRIGMAGIDPRLIEAAHTLGAGRLDTVLTIILPLTRRAALAGAVLMFARGLGEFGATIIVAGNIPGATQTIPLAIYDYASSPSGEGMALALCGVAVAISVAVLLLHEYLGKQLAEAH